MVRLRPWCLVVLCCFWVGSGLFGCGDSDETPPASQKVVKGKVPTVQLAAGTETTKSPAPALGVESAKDTPDPVFATPAPKSETEKPDEPQETVSASRQDESSGSAEPESPGTRDDGETVPMEDGLLAAAKLKRLLRLDTAFSYDAKDKIDPFKPVFGSDTPESPSDRRGQETAERKKRIPASPIEMVDLSQLKLTAVVLAPSGNLAMVEDATGKGYIVKKDTYIGNREGRVTKILPDRLIITEQGIDDLGKPMSEVREIQLPKPPGEI